MSGEYYVVACPHCHDTKGHLYINHRWGIRDPVNRTRNLWLANCFLCNSMSEWKNRMDLADRLEDYTLAVRAGALPAPVIVTAEPELAERPLPTDFHTLDELPRSHLANRYVLNRGFDPHELTRLWGVGFSSREYPYDFPGRLVLPLRAHPGDAGPSALTDPGGWIVVGYTGRALGDATVVSKYITCLRAQTSRILYGLDRVPADDTRVIVVEGPADVWRAGPGAVAVLGKFISDAQRQLIRSVLPGRDIVVMFDPDAVEDADTAADKLRDVLGRDLTSGVKPGRVVVARLFADRDPGDCTRKEVKAAAHRALQGRANRGRKADR